MSSSHVIGVAPPTSPSCEEHHQTPIGFNPFGVSLATPMKELQRPSASLSCLGDPMPSTVPASKSISHIPFMMFFVDLAHVRLELDIPVVVVFLVAAERWWSTQPVVEVSGRLCHQCTCRPSSWTIMAACWCGAAVTVSTCPVSSPSVRSLSCAFCAVHRLSLAVHDLFLVRTVLVALVWNNTSCGCQFLSTAS